MELRSEFKPTALREYLTLYNRVWSHLTRSGDSHTAADEVYEKRNYTDPDIRDTFKAHGLTKIPDSAWDSIPRESSLGLFLENGLPLLAGRYLLPIRDIQGNVISIVGWLDDDKKYITAGSEYFSKATMFYGMENLVSARTKPAVFLCEGIFDRLSLQHLGLTAFATMGADVSPPKRILYSLMGRIVAIPDADSTGQKVIRDNTWQVLTGSSYLRWRGGIPVKDKVLKLKDIDDFCKFLPKDFLHEMFQYATQSRYRSIITVEL